MTDSTSKQKFLFDTGADISVFPRRCITGHCPKDEFTLYAANGSKINTFGVKRLSLDFGLHKRFEWSFIIADVTNAIIGADFISFYKLLPDLANRCLRDGSSSLYSKGNIVKCADQTIKMINITCPYQKLLSQFPELMKPPGLVLPKVKHNTKHHIVTTKGPPVVFKARRLFGEKLTNAKDEFETMLKSDIIRPSNSNWASPIHMVLKKNGEWRPCGDYRNLNERTIDDKYPVPHIEDFTQYLAGTNIYSSLDLVKAYYQIPMAEEDIAKTAVITPFGLFEFKRMPFGLCNAAQTFQRFIHEITRGLSFCFAYLDDILIASTSAEEHIQHLSVLFQRLKDYGVVLNPDKCVFGVKELKFLGYLVNKKGIAPLPDRVNDINKFANPDTTTKLRRFLGTVNFYRRFVKGAAEIQKPLNKYLQGETKKDAHIELDEDALEAIKNLKTALLTAALLAHPKKDAQISLMVDASNTAVGATLQQLVYGEWQPLAFFSSQLTPAQTNWSAYDRELLAAYLAVKKFRYLLEGRTFTLYTDHKPLMYAFRQKPDKASPRQFRHLYFIGQYTTDIRHISGTDNVPADAFSRVEVVHAIDYKALADEQTNDEDLRKAKDANTLDIRKSNIPGVEDSIYCDFSTGKARVFVPKVCRNSVIQAQHQLSHPGVRATSKLVKRSFVWPNMDSDVKDFVRACCQCQRNKIQRHTKTPRGRFELPSQRFEHIHVDIVGPLPPSRGYTYCLTVIDRFTRWPEVIPMMDQTAESVAQALIDGWISRFGVPKIITTDQGRQFESHVFSGLNKTLGSVRIRTSPYHPSANGLIERLHRQLKAAIRARDSINWALELPIVLLGFRCAFKEDIKATPAEMLYGQTIKMPGEFFTDNRYNNIPDTQFATELRDVMRDVRPRQTSWHGEGDTYVPTDLLNAENVFVRTGQIRKALDPPYDGPFPVLSMNGKTAVIEMDGNPVTVSLDRMKPAYTLDQVEHEPIVQGVVKKRVSFMLTESLVPLIAGKGVM